MDKEVEDTYEEFWKPIVEHDGVIDMEQIKKELYDYRMIMQEVSKVYLEITNGKFSKPNTAAIYILDEYYQRLDEAMLELLK